MAFKRGDSHFHRTVTPPKFVPTPVAAPGSNFVGQTTTSMARLAASREVMGVWGDEGVPFGAGQDPSDMRLNIMTGLSLENIQGPIPELAGDTPAWLEVYANAAARQGNDSIRRRGPQLDTIPGRRSRDESSEEGPRGKPSPYAQPMRLPDAPRRLAPAFPAVGGGGASFDDVYRADAAHGGVVDDYAAALASLTSLGYEAGPDDLERADQVLLAQQGGGGGVGTGGGAGGGSGGAGGGSSSAAKGVLTSKFPTKGGGGGVVRPRGGGPQFVSGGCGFMHKATSTSVLAAIRRLNLARAIEAANRARIEEANKPKPVKEKKAKVDKPPTTRTSVQFEDGSKYRGDWSTRGLGAHGQGILTFPSGDKYVGGFKRHLFEGKGTYYYANGDRYEGPWRHGEKHGEAGTFVRAKDGTTLVVDWSHDKANGIGKCTYGNGATFVGLYKDDVKEGEGTYQAPSGDVYRGEFQQDRIMGKGLFIDKKNNASYSGQFANSKRKGRSDDRSEFTLHHGLYGDFGYKGGESYGGIGVGAKGEGDHFDVDDPAAGGGASPPGPPGRAKTGKAKTGH